MKQAASGFLIGALVLLQACGQATRRIDLVSDITAADHGTKSVLGKSDAQLEAGSFYFSPSFMRGAAGQTLAIHLRNVSKIEHNFTIEGQGVNVELGPNQTASVLVTFPSSGALLFICSLHRYDGMAGELLVDDATPQPP